ncbi:MAG TPA: hypothetical protein VMV89_09315 [Candidatus Paceibacterota bacterium]|nr:hypothetical protein [Candidatus Paceibacterota bacterium]
MRLHFKEDAKEWRKVTLLGLIGPAVIIGILRWRGAVSSTCLAAVLVLVVLMALCAWLRPRWFRGYYRFTTRLGFYTFQILGKIVLVAFFFLILTPFGWILRLLGKDFLQLKPPRDKQTFWQKAGQDGSLDSIF